MSAMKASTSVDGSAFQMTVFSMEAGSRASAWQWRSSTSSLWATTDGSPAKRLQASAYRATNNRVLRSPLPPMRIRGPGSWIGGGEQIVSASW